MVPVDNENECLKKLFEGEIRRSIAIGSTYPASHLSMSVITFHVSNLSLITSWGIVTTAKVIIRYIICISMSFLNREIGDNRIPN